jgi:hypothetical protein
VGETLQQVVDALAAAQSVVGAFLRAYPLVKDLLVAVATSALAAVFVRGFIRRREEKERKRLLAPMRDLAVQSVVAAHGSFYSHLLAFGERDYKRIETRVARLQGQFASTLAEFKVRMATYLTWFDQAEREALFAYCEAADAKRITATSTRHEVESWVRGVNDGLRGLARSLPSKERASLTEALWDEPAVADLWETLFSRFRTPIQSVAASSDPLGARVAPAQVRSIGRS